LKIVFFSEAMKEAIWCCVCILQN